jgi:hypothetical protein
MGTGYVLSSAINHLLIGVKKMKKHLLIIMGMVCLIVFGVTESSSLSGESRGGSSLEYITTVGDNSSINWTTKVIKVKGYGVGPGKVKELGRRKLMAQRAAEMDAQRKLLEAVKGVQVTSYTNIDNMARKNHAVNTKVSGMLRGMRVVGVTYSNDGSCTVTMEINIDKEGNFLLAALNDGVIKITDNYPKFDWIKARKDLEEAKVQLAAIKKQHAKAKMEIHTKEELLKDKQNEIEGIQSKYASLSADFKTKIEELKKANKKRAPNPPGKKFIPTKSVTPEQDVAPSPGPPAAVKKYTGLLVDASGVDLKPALAPSILNQKEEKMYGIGVIPAEFARGAIVSYLHGNIERAKKQKEIGDNPLVVKCVRIINKSDIIISDQDAQKLVLIDQILKQKRVAILI